VDHFPPPENKKLSVSKSEELPCVKKLRIFCGKNAYVRSVLYMELARVEEGEDPREGLLQVGDEVVGCRAMVGLGWSACVCVCVCVCVESLQYL
jgi:hypothetical protein